MQTSTYNMTIEQGTDFSVNFVFQDGNGNPIDLTTSTFTAEIRTSYQSTTVIASLTPLVSANQLTLSLSSADTASLPVAPFAGPGTPNLILYWDLKWVTSGSTSRPIQGQVYVSPEITE